MELVRFSQSGSDRLLRNVFCPYPESRRSERLGEGASAVLGRAPDAAGMRSYLAARSRPGTSIRSIETSFLASSENVRNLADRQWPLASPLLTEYPLTYSYGDPSTHEIVEDTLHPGIFWISGQLHDALVRFDSTTGVRTTYQLDSGAKPRGITLNAAGQMFVSLERLSHVGEFDRTTGLILPSSIVDVSLIVTGAPGPMTSSPHDITMGADGVTIWFTGKATSTIGKINPDRSVNHYQLPTLGALPIYLNLGPDGNIWGTELQGNKILRITSTGVVTEFTIPTYNSRPISIFPDPLGRPYMWFTEEAGHTIGKISTTTGVIEEFQVPNTQSNMILASLAFDRDGNLYTQSYVNHNSATPPGPDSIVKLSRESLFAAAGDLSHVQVTNYQVPSRNTVFHRIALGSDGNMYFTELATDNAGRLLVGTTPPPLSIFTFQFGMSLFEQTVVVRTADDDDFFSLATTEACPHNPWVKGSGEPIDSPAMPA